MADPVQTPVVEPVVPAPAAPAPAAASTPPAAATPSDPPAGDPAPVVEGGAAAPVDPAAPPVAPAAAEPPKDAWKAQKYDKVYAKLKETEAELAAAKKAQADPAAGAARLDESEINRRAAQQAATLEFNRKCNEVAVEARKVYPTFDQSIKNLGKLVTPGDQGEIVAYSRLVEAALETGEGGRLLYELGGNLDEAQRIMNLSPVKQGIELAKLAAKKGEPEPSKLSPPITPIGNRGGGASTMEIKPEDAVRADKLSTREWIERRQRGIDERRKAGERIW